LVCPAAGPAELTAVSTLRSSNASGSTTEPARADIIEFYARSGQQRALVHLGLQPLHGESGAFVDAAVDRVHAVGDVRSPIRTA
jgi:hypothetical protein